MSLLHVGDIISLFSHGFLATLGLVDDRCVLQPSEQEPPKKFRDCLFRVCIQHKYDVQNELWRSDISHMASATGSGSSHSHHHHHQDEELYKKLYTAAKLEQESNQEKNLQKRGTVVKYEDIIQLLHIKSNKYITVNTKGAALEEPGAIRVYLDANGNEESWFRVRSPYKYRSNGEDVVCESVALVSNSNQTTMTSPTMNNNNDDVLFLHASSYRLRDNLECLEINASRQSTSWDIKLFLDYTEDLDDYLKGGDVVRLFHTDQEKFLTLDTYNNDGVHHVFLRSTDRAKAASATSSKALWEIEVVQPDPCRASLAHWNSLIRLKHLATERFLAADQDYDSTLDPMREKLRQKNGPVYKLISLEYSYDYATLFEFDSTTTNINDDAYIPINSNITLKHHPTGTYVHSTSIFIDKDKKKSGMSRVGCAQNKGLDEVFAVIPVSATEIRDLDFVHDAFKLLEEAHDLILRGQQVDVEDAHHKLSELLPEIIHFIANKESEPHKVEKALTMAAENPNRERQKLIREQDVLKLLFNILELEAGTQSRTPNKDICRLCYRVLRLSFQDYRKNQEYIVKWDTFMKSQFGLDISAEFTYSKLFHSNRNLLEKSFGAGDVEIFVKLIKKKRYSSFLDCLSNLCISANGTVSSQTQRLICDSILSESNRDVLIETIEITRNNLILSTAHWQPANNHDTEHNNLDNNNQTLNSNVPIVIVRKALKEVIQGVRNGSKEDAFLLDYYKHQLDLLSALCMARQAKAIEILSSRLSLELIQDSIADSELPCDLRASFCKLLSHLYLIRVPQTYSPPISIERDWNNIPNNLDVDVYDRTGSRLSPFQVNNRQFEETMEFVELYLSDLTSVSVKSSSIYFNTERNKLTFEIINLNRELTYFGFYKLKDFLRLSHILLKLLEGEKKQQQLVMKIKIKIIEILKYIFEVRIDYLVSTLLTIIKSGHQQQTSPSSTTTATTTTTIAGADSSSQIVIKIIQALDQHLKDMSLGNSDSRKFVNVLLHLVKHDCPDLVSASLKLLLDYGSQRKRILDTFKAIELLNAPNTVQDKFKRLHPLIERSDRYIRRGFDDNHAAVNEILIQDANLISFIVQHIQYLIKNKDEERLTKDLLRSLRNLIPIQRQEHLLEPRQKSKDGNKKNKSNTPKIDLPDIQCKLDFHGVSSLVIELISMSSSTCEERVRERSASVFKDTLALGIALLEGGNHITQTSIYDKLTKKGELDKSEKFFEVLSNRMNLAQQALSPGNETMQKSDAINHAQLKRGTSIEYRSPKLLTLSADSLTLSQDIKEDLEATIATTEKVLLMTSSVPVAHPPKLMSHSNKHQLPELVDIMRPILCFLQLMCEDHNLTMQNFMHSQQNKTSYNLVAKTLVFLNCICGSKEGSLGHKLGEYIRENNVDLINQTLKTLTEFCQGPCSENQRCILLHESNGIDMIRSLILDNIEPLDKLRMDLVLELKDNASKLLLALMESCSDPTLSRRILRESSLIRKLIDVAIVYYLEHDDANTFSDLITDEIHSISDGMIRPRDVGHKIFILCHQLVQQYNMIPEVIASNFLAKIPTSEEANAKALKMESLSAKDACLREASALHYYESHTAQIEIVRGNREMERVVFQVPQICEHLTQETKMSVYHNTEQDERGSKIPNFLLEVDNLFDEMKWQRALQARPLLHSVARYMSLWSSIEFKLSLLVTMLVLFCVSKHSSTMDDNSNDNNLASGNSIQATTQKSSLLTSSISTILAVACSTFFVFQPKIQHAWTFFLVLLTLYLTQVVGECTALKVLGLFLEVVSIMHLLSVLINRGIINKPLQHILSESEVTYHGSYFIVCTLGFLFHPLFYPFLLPPSLIRREETLRSVMKSVTKNAYSIVMTGLLGLIIILLYTIINYLYFGEDFVIDLDDGSQYKPCLGILWECYLAHVNYGLRDGGGIGERIRDTRLELTMRNAIRIICIMSFFLVVNLMILQLVYCIIVDTFATLRSEKQQKEEILRNSCFVCGLNRTLFENRAVTFEEHIQTEHNLWHYLYFIVSIKMKSRTELSGPEFFVHGNKDHSWLPRMRAISLNSDNYAMCNSQT